MTRNILEYLEHSVENYASKVAFADENNSCTYEELELRAKAVGSYLSKHTEPRKPIPFLWIKV